MTFFKKIWIDYCTDKVEWKLDLELLSKKKLLWVYDKDKIRKHHPNRK